jgi:hypothetical protein
LRCAAAAGGALFSTAGGALGAGRTGEFTFRVGCSDWWRGPHEASASSEMAAQ